MYNGAVLKVTSIDILFNPTQDRVPCTKKDVCMPINITTDAAPVYHCDHTHTVGPL